MILNIVLKHYLYLIYYSKLHLNLDLKHLLIVLLVSLQIHTRLFLKTSVNQVFIIEIFVSKYHRKMHRPLEHVQKKKWKFRGIRCKRMKVFSAWLRIKWSLVSLSCKTSMWKKVFGICVCAKRLICLKRILLMYYNTYYKHLFPIFFFLLP